MNILCEPLVRDVHMFGRRFRLKTGFYRVLQCQEALADAMIDDTEKIDLCLKLLVKNTWRLKKLSREKRMRLFEEIFSTYVDAGGKKSRGPQSLDFRQDAAYIYAAFAQSYGMDLIGKDRELEWQKFLCLLGALPDDTRLMQIASIRTRPMPKANKYNAQERAELARLKAEYRIRLSEEESARQRANGFEKIAMALEGMARKKT